MFQSARASSFLRIIAEPEHGASKMIASNFPSSHPFAFAKSPETMEILPKPSLSMFLEVIN